ncbi:MAG: LuxR C-terminal-related transcriptional regulator, partial [Propionibacteriaceae bacterium]|nr:LuxR C-terminal-related transcriptional regulator [Propionibacteriaceae bacterium]
QTVSSLVRALSGRNPVLIVEDAEHLDIESIGAIAAARSRSPFTILATSRRGRPQAAAVGLMTKRIRPIWRINMEPMRFDALHSFVHELLPGVVDSNTVARLATASGGLPSLVRSLVAAARDDGRLVTENEQWRIDGPLYSPLMAESMRPLIEVLDDEQFIGLSKLAMMGSMMIGEAERNIGFDVLNALDDYGLLQVSHGIDGPVVSVFPPIVGDFLRDENGATRVLFLRSELDHSGLPMDWATSRRDEVLSQPSVLSSRIWEHWHAEAATLAEAWRAEPTPEHAVPLLAALHATAASDKEMRTIVERTKMDGSNTYWRIRLGMWLAIQRAVNGADLAGAIKLVEEMAVAAGSTDSLIDTAVGHLRFLEDRVPDWEAIDKTDQDPFTQEVQTLLEVECKLAEGMVDDALDLLKDYDPEEHGYADHAPIYYGLALLLSGRLEEGVAWAQRQLVLAEEKLLPGQMQAHGYVAAFGLALQGRYGEVDRIASTVLTLTGVSTLYEHFLSGLLVLSAISSSWTGRTDYAHKLADQALPFGKLGPFPCMLSSVAPALVCGRGPEAAHEVWQAAEDRLDRGYVASAIFLAAGAVELGPDPQRAAKINKAAQRTQSELLRSLGFYAWASSTMDIDAMRASIVDLDRTNTSIHVLRAKVRLAMALRSKGELQASSKAADEAWSSMDIPEEVRRSIFGPLVEAVDLSPRELEIANLLTQGAVPAEIAIELDVSVRTVESHVSNIYRKVGVSSRSRLKAIMATWLSPAVA